MSFQNVFVLIISLIGPSRSSWYRIAGPVRVMTWSLKAPLLVKESEVGYQCLRVILSSPTNDLQVGLELKVWLIWTVMGLLSNLDGTMSLRLPVVLDANMRMGMGIALAWHWHIASTRHIKGMVNCIITYGI